MLCVLGLVGASLCVNEVEYEGNYADNYDNEISQDQQEGEFCLSFLFTACLNRWPIVRISKNLSSAAMPDFIKQIIILVIENSSTHFQVSSWSTSILSMHNKRKFAIAATTASCCVHEFTHTTSQTLGLLGKNCGHYGYIWLIIM